MVSLFASKLHDHLTCGNGIATRQPGASGLARKTPLTWVNACAPGRIRTCGLPGCSYSLYLRKLVMYLL